VAENHEAAYTNRYLNSWCSHHWPKQPHQVFTS